jgi:hypothetical protein
MLGSRHALLGLLVSLAAILATDIRPPAAQTASRVAPEAGARNTPTAVANGENVKAARVNNWTVGIAAGLLEAASSDLRPNSQRRSTTATIFAFCRSSPTARSKTSPTSSI